MRTTAFDALLSAQRYLAIAMGVPWDVRLWSEEGAFSPPVARIAESGPLLSARHGRASTDLTLPLQLHAYTAPALTPTESLARARAAEELLHVAIEVGVGDARPRRIPLYSFPEETRNVYDFLRVVDFSVNRVSDSEDPTLVVVVADLRVQWSRATVVEPETITVADVRSRTHLP
jgi:hypothetical protein